MRLLLPTGYDWETLLRASRFGCRQAHQGKSRDVIVGRACAHELFHAVQYVTAELFRIGDGSFLKSLLHTFQAEFLSLAFPFGDSAGNE